MSFDVDRYDPCRSGSAKKFKFCCSRKSKKGEYPVGTVAH
jgi:hypothetical protein